ncbi:MAG: hypothetical protein MRZ79_11530 [Bacteroidia bacterium]|nr:hypothetical protein [Bacteroidia bacterium]
MKNWEEFQSIHPTLQRIENTYIQLVEFLQEYSPSESHIHGLTEEDIVETRASILEVMAKDANKITGRIYYWLYPFYEGNFLKLVAALGACNSMEKQEDDDESRKAFYRFFRTVPVEERLKIGDRLNDPGLTQQAIKIQDKIKTRKAQIKIKLDKFHSN